MKLDIIASNRFKKDLKLIRKHGMNLKNLEFVIDTLANKKKLDIKYRDHALAGKYKNFRECHIEPDWLLVYKITESVLVLTLYRTGSHSDLF